MTARASKRKKQLDGKVPQLDFGHRFVAKLPNPMGRKARAPKSPERIAHT